MEIEVKARIADTSSVIGKLTSLGCVFSEPVTQDDMVYVEKTGSLDDFLSNDVFLRIRIQNDGKVVLTAKRPLKKSAEVLVKHECEVTVDSAFQAQGILELMGYSQTVRVKKVRQKAHHGAYEICIDDIEGLGSFIELEQIDEESKAEEIQKGMLDFLLSLGISPEQQVKKGYDILMLEKNSS